jgi:hypothetical protein
MGCDEQNGLPVSMGKMQRQPVRQGLLTPQLPPQVAEPLASLCNCRAETVPAHRTPMTSAEKNIDLNFFIIASSFLFPGRNVTGPTPTGYFAGLAAMNPHTPVVALGLLKTHPQPRTLGQGCVLLQKWCWQVVS